MLLDNANDNLKVHEWIAQNTENGSFDLVTGYFTIGALKYLSDVTNQKIKEYRLVIGDIVHTADDKVKALDLLNENISIENGFKLATLAKEAVAFLKQDKVLCKTLEPNFCHAKLYLTSSSPKNPMKESYIMGSSNLTEAGIGLKPNQNIELNSAGTGTEAVYKELKEWFESLWASPKAHTKKSIFDAHGKIKKVEFKQYLIDEISKIFKIYTPAEIYQKILFELFYLEEDVDYERTVGKLENTKIFTSLFPFQQKGALNLISILNKYNGAILADAVGLGKTWTTLAVIKYFRFLGRKTVLLCPKKLEHNWKQYLENENSLFEEEEFNYKVHFHTDFTEDSTERGRINFDFLNNEDPKLIVIDESHNLRNDKSIKYKVLMEEVLKKSKGDIKVLLLSATPINNNFNDVKNQFALMVKGANDGFEDSLQVRSLDSTFRKLQTEFKSWNKKPEDSLASFYQRVDNSDFFKLTENLVVARTRKRIKTFFDKDFHFPKHKKAINIFKTPLKIGDFVDFADLDEKLDLNLSAYQPSQFTMTLAEVEAERIKKEEKKRKKGDILKDDAQREFFLVKMMKILMLKRLESSWWAFYLTVQNIYNHHENAIKKIDQYKDTRDGALVLSTEDMNPEEVDEEYEAQLDSFQLGKKKPISLREIDAVDRLDDFRKSIRRDKENLLLILENLKTFEKNFQENSKVDEKLVELIHLITQKQQTSNPKLIIFTTYKDTALYLFEQLQRAGFSRLGVVYGNEAKTDLAGKSPDINTLLQHFAPYTKLFLEKRWVGFEPKKSMETFAAWQDWVKKEHPKTKNILENPIDILITTDVLSEGQNLQDADTVVNYDIHWNPVRVIQRLGRVDRIGSPNPEIQCVNFWPAPSIDASINLKSRVENRMAVMQFIGSEVVQNFTEEFSEIADNPLETRQTNALLRQMETSLEDIDGENSLGFDDFSFDVFKQQLLDYLNTHKKHLEDLPSGIFSGFKVAHDQEEGIIAFVGKKPKVMGKYSQYYLIHLDWKGNVLRDNHKTVLEFLAEYQVGSMTSPVDRQVPQEVDQGNPEDLRKLAQLLADYIQGFSTREEVLPDGTVKQKMGTASLDALNKLKRGNKAVLQKIKDGDLSTQRFTHDQFDLITWLILTNQPSHD